ncbi:MAG: hypothetical protein K6F45_03110 [Saccharofermentans sp.]|nr:hypothetical protein [Saccharofermentans sp.]
MGKIMKKILSIAVASAVALSFTGFLSMESNADGDCGYKLSGMAHVQDQGDTAGTFDSSTGILTLGTRGLSRRVEAISVNIDEAPEGLTGGIEYTVHVQDKGWLQIDGYDWWACDGEMIGTSGESKRLEGMRIMLTGDLYYMYSVQYQVHIQDYGDAQGFVKDGALAGTTGESKRLEEVQIKLVKLDSANGIMSVNYRVHVQDKGWESTYAKDGDYSGTTGEAKRLEGFEMFLSGNKCTGNIVYRTHIQDYGWEPQWSMDGQMSGTQGEAKRLEAIQIDLWGDVAIYYDVYYRVHSQDYGWLGWAKNGETAGTAGKALRLESIQVVLIPKGGAAPGSTDGAFKYPEIDMSSLSSSAKTADADWYDTDPAEEFYNKVYVGTTFLDLWGPDVDSAKQTCKYFYSADSTFTSEELSNPIATGTYEPTASGDHSIDWCLVYYGGKLIASRWGSDEVFYAMNEGNKLIDTGYYKCIVYDESGTEIAQATCYVM